MTQENPFLAPIPSVPYIVRCLYQYIANHPLIINPLVKHPTTGEVQDIKRYRLYSGINIPSDGVSMAVFPYSSERIQPPSSTSVSAVVDPYTLGSKEGYDKIAYFIVVAFYYNEVVIGNREETNEDLITVPQYAEFNSIDQVRNSISTKRLELEIVPGMDIIGEYLALTRLIINDVDYRSQFPIQVTSFEVLYENLKSQPWETNRNVFFQEGFTMIRLDAHVSRGWRDKFNYSVQDFNVNINPVKQ